jgi:uncharacterized protein (DUF2147 family)
VGNKFRRNCVRKSFLVCVLLTALFGLVTLPLAAAQAPVTKSPVGLWKTIDDATGKAKSIVMIWEENGKLFGRVQKLIDPDPKNPEPKCVDCSGEQKDKPVVGLRILWDLEKDGEAWSGGTILDPANGKAYKCLLSLVDDGEKLKVRGFIGLSLLGRTQYWARE